MTMDAATFTEALGRLSAEEIRSCARSLDVAEMSVADEVSQWRAELAIDRVLRLHCARVETQRANAAAHRAARMVVDTAQRQGFETPDSDLTRVARTASQIARGLAVSSLAGSFVQVILRRWERAMSAARGPVLTVA